MAIGLADLFKQIAAGIYVIGVAHEDRRNAFTAAWIMQVSFTPPLLALSINPHQASYPLLTAGRIFSVNVLRRGQIALAWHFGTRSVRDFDKLAGIPWRLGLTGAPILADSLAFFDCQLVQSLRTGDHELVIGQVLDGAMVTPDAAPMTYAETGDLDGSSKLYPSGL